MPPDSATRLSFGDFVFDTASGDLHRNGAVTRLAPQVAAVLALLAARPGDVITRNELRDALWPDTTVEFDQGLNFCIRQLRVALSDDAAEPKYIETLHRRGYRFVAAVAAAGVERSDDARPDHSATERPASRRWVPIAVAVVLVVLAAAAARFIVRDTPASLASARIAVLEFDLPTDATLAAYQGQLAEALVTSVGRGQLDRLAVMGPSFTSRFAGTATPPDSIRGAIGATHILSGTLRVEGRGVRVFAQLIRTSDRRHLWAGRFIDSAATGGASQIVSIADTIARAATNIVARDRL